MSLGYTKKEVAKVAAVLDEEHESAEAAALACLGVMEEVFETRSKFVVVGQLLVAKSRGRIQPNDPEAIKLSLGWYSTEGDARKAAEGLWHNTASGDMFRTWMLNVHHGTPAEFHSERKQQYIALEAKQAEARQERLRKSIEDWRIKSEAAVHAALAEQKER